MNKTLFAIISTFACIFLFLPGCGEPLSSHHASIRILLEPDGIHSEEAAIQRKNETDKHLAKLTSVIEEFGLEPVKEAKPPFNTVTFGYEESDKTLKFRGKSQGKKNTIPIEAVIIVDMKEFETIQIYLSEAYSVEPSESLRELYSKLNEAIEYMNSQKNSKLW